MNDRHDHLDASLEDFEPPASPTLHLRHSALRSEAAMTEDDLDDSEIASVGGYSPPAWRRLGNGDRSNGFWRGPDHVLGGFPFPRFERETSPEFDDDSEDDVVLERAIQTRLPKGSMSPDKGMSPSPERQDDTTLRMNAIQPASPSTELTMSDPPPDNCMAHIT